MIVDGEALRPRQRDRDAARGRARTGDIKPELMESVLEISTDPCRNTAEAGAQLRGAAGAGARARRGAAGLTIGSPGTHPFAMWEDQRIVGRDRYRDLISALRFVARQELIFGMHVHVGVDDPDKAIHVANGMRVHVPVLLALSANSPFWRADVDRPALDAHADLPRLPARRRPAGLRRPGRTTPTQIDFMVRSGVMEDYTYLWYDVRPHPRLRHGRDPRAATARRAIEHTLGLAALIQAMVKELCEHFDAGEALSRLPVADARREQVARRAPRTRRRRSSTCPGSDRVSARDLAQRLLDRLRAARPGPRLGRRSCRASRTSCATAPAPRASSRSTRPTTTCARS